MSDLAVGDDGITRCPWPGSDPLYLDYHDTEWGHPVLSDAGLYERVALEGFQAGLSWITTLRKREAFREVFAGFDPTTVSRFGDREVRRLLDDARIIRNRAKIRAAINNASRALELSAEFGSVAAFLARYADFARQAPASLGDIPAITEGSKGLSRDLKARGWSFVGPTTMYALMQAVGLVNDHLDGCHARAASEESRGAWRVV
ncbi:MAG TPA: DNA-3-methyladenine glycosylase I [Acidimicrobiia bacterium]|nr:DNA-3-methyladenine glycosylase I [Acidimicrobiia bacterium]